jgi:hypothetical protein
LQVPHCGATAGKFQLVEQPNQEADNRIEKDDQEADRNPGAPIATWLFLGKLISADEATIRIVCDD